MRRAGREALEPELARIERDEERALSVVASTGSLALVPASLSERAALRKAVQPVYDELGRDEQTRELIAEIRELQDEASASVSAAPRCPGGSASGGKAGTSVRSRISGRRRGRATS